MNVANPTEIRTQHTDFYFRLANRYINFSSLQRFLKKNKKHTSVNQ